MRIYDNVRVRIRTIRAKIGNAHSLHWVHEYGHMGYFGFVFWEGHSIYAMIAGGLFVVSFLMAIGGGEVD